MVAVGDIVVLRVSNPFLHGQLARVERLESWGAHVSTLAAATGQFRALFSEMLPATPASPTMDATGEICSNCGGMRLQRSGACLVCLDCGTSNGCA
jgi:hypothetical protein